jgi:hypothetical protein
VKAVVFFVFVGEIFAAVGRFVVRVGWRAYVQEGVPACGAAAMLRLRI